MGIGWASVFAQVIVATVVMSIVIGIAILWTRRKRYPLNVIVLEYRGASARLRFTKARRILKKGKEAIELQDTKDFIMPFGYLDTIVDKKGRTWYILVQHAPKEYAPAAVSPGQKVKVPVQTEDGRIVEQELPLYQVLPKIDASQKMAYAESLEMSYNVYHDKTFWEKAQPFIFMGVLLVVVLAAIQLMGNMEANVAKITAEAVKQLASATNKLTQVESQLLPYLKQAVSSAAQVNATKPPA